MKYETYAITLLLGSGISIPAGMPSTTKITEKILSGEDVMHHTDGNYYFDEPPTAEYGIPDEYVPRVVEFLKKLKREIDIYYSGYPARNTNYEDLYYVVSQIEDSEIGEYDNPIVKPFIDKILPEVSPLLIGNEGEIRERWELHELAGESAFYIRDVVWHLLNKEPTCTSHLNCLKDACLDSELLNIDIFTLNHDLILENYLSENKIAIIDGFDKPINGVQYWKPNLFKDIPSKIRLFKLHGSINWFRLRPDRGDWGDESIGIPSGMDFWHTESPDNKMQWPIDCRPMFLAGTFNKMLQYNHGIYTLLQHKFYNSLSNTRYLVVCGYSFGDKGINTRIIEWIYSSPNQKLLVIHHEPDGLKESARGTVSNKWDEWIQQGKLTILQKNIEETSWQDIRDQLF